MGNMKYNVGDRVQIKSLDWYNKNKDNYGAIYAGNGFCFWKNMSRHCGEIMKITIVKIDPEDSNKGYYFMENCEERWTDEMIEGLVEEEIKPNIIEEAKTYWDSIKDAWICPEGYQFVDENGNVINTQKIVLVKKNKYPKTYEKCCKVLGVSEFEYNHTGTKVWYRHKLMATLDKLMLCRDAYWKIAGEEMGLGKPWEPDWNDKKQDKHGFYNEIKNTIINSKVFVFPTAKMRDTFYENFKELIEFVKELL